MHAADILLAAEPTCSSNVAHQKLCELVQMLHHRATGHFTSQSGSTVGPVRQIEPPRMPNLCHISFSQVHLSVVDEATVADFLTTLQSQDELNLRDRIRWSFNIMCYDFGAQLFLQRPNLLQVALILLGIIR